MFLAKISQHSVQLCRNKLLNKKNILSILKGFRVTTMFPQFLQYEILRPTFSLVKQIGNYFSLFDVVNTGTNCWKPLVSWRSLCQLKNVMERHIILWRQHLSFRVLITTVSEMASVQGISSKISQHSFQICRNKLLNKKNLLSFLKASE